MNFYVDTSALNRRYLNETGAVWVRSWIRPAAGNVITVSDLAAIEGFSAYARLRRENRLTPLRHARVQSLLLWHIEREYLVIPLIETVLSQARRLINAYPLRTLDAIQLASAEYAVSMLQEPITFITGDVRLKTAAVVEGFTVDDPNLHP